MKALSIITSSSKDCKTGHFIHCIVRCVRGRTVSSMQVYSVHFTQVPCHPADPVGHWYTCRLPLVANLLPCNSSYEIHVDYDHRTDFLYMLKIKVTKGCHKFPFPSGRSGQSWPGLQCGRSSRYVNLIDYRYGEGCASKDVTVEVLLNKYYLSPELFKETQVLSLRCDGFIFCTIFMREA